MANRRNISVLVPLLIATAFTVLAVRADEQQDRTNAAYARLHAKQIAATQPATISNAEVQELQSELTALRAENAKLRALLEKAAVALQQAQATAQQPAAVGVDSKIAAAIAQHTLADGMTLAHAEKALSLEFKPMNEENSDGQDYVAIADRHQIPFRNVGGGMMAGGQIVGIQYKIHIKDGVVTFWSKSGFSLDPGTAAVGDSRAR